jgi:hypothetical protein
MCQKIIFPLARCTEHHKKRLLLEVADFPRYFPEQQPLTFADLIGRL